MPNYDKQEWEKFFHWVASQYGWTAALGFGPLSYRDTHSYQIWLKYDKPAKKLESLGPVELPIEPTFGGGELPGSVTLGKGTTWEQEIKILDWVWMPELSVYVPVLENTSLVVPERIQQVMESVADISGISLEDIVLASMYHTVAEELETETGLTSAILSTSKGLTDFLTDQARLLATEGSTVKGRQPMEALGTALKTLGKDFMADIEASGQDLLTALSPEAYEYLNAVVAGTYTPPAPIKEVGWGEFAPWMVEPGYTPPYQPTTLEAEVKRITGMEAPGLYNQYIRSLFPELITEKTAGPSAAAIREYGPAWAMGQEDPLAKAEAMLEFMEDYYPGEHIMEKEQLRAGIKKMKAEGVEVTGAEVPSLGLYIPPGAHGYEKFLSSLYQAYGQELTPQQKKEYGEILSVEEIRQLQLGKPTDLKFLERMATDRMGARVSKAGELAWERLPYTEREIAEEGERRAKSQEERLRRQQETEQKEWERLTREARQRPERVSRL